MNRNFRYTVFALLLGLVALSSCKKDEIDRFAMENAAYYFTSNFAEYSFLQTPNDPSADVQIEVTTVGPVADVDRKIEVEVDTENTTATSSQFQIVEAVVPAGQSFGHVTVRVMNDVAVLAEDDLTLTIKLLPTADFDLNINSETLAKRGQNQAMPIYMTASVRWTNKVTMPEYWLKGGYGKYVSFTDVYADDGNPDYVYGEQNGAGTRKLLKAKYVTAGLYSEKLGRILLEVWPAYVNVNGYLGTDEETLAKYPLVTAMSASSVLLVHKLETYVTNYNLAHPGDPLRHSDDAACYTNAGAISTLSSGGVKYNLQFKENPPIRINPYAGQYGY